MADIAKTPRIPVSQDPERLTAPAARALKSLCDGRLCRQFVDDERIPAGVAYWVEPGGKKVAREAAEELIRKGRVSPQGDALFADLAQSYVVASA